MELRTIVGCYEIEEKLGENASIVFKLIVPPNFTWETLHQAITNYATGAKSWESMNKKPEDNVVPEAESVQSASGIIEPEVVA